MLIKFEGYADGEWRKLWFAGFSHKDGGLPKGEPLKKDAKKLKPERAKQVKEALEGMGFSKVTLTH